jgi:Flp pilus assembly protein CpaB
VSSRRTLILIGAILVGIIAAFLLYNYVQGIENNANEDAVLVDVYSAKSDIVRATDGGLAAADGAVASSSIPQQYRPVTAITTLDQIQKKVAIFDIAKGTVIVVGMFVDPAQQQISFRSRLKNPEHVAISIAVDAVHGVAGFLVPGDEVNIMAKGSDAPAPADGETDASGTTTAFISSSYRYLYQQVQILAVGSNVLLAPGETVPEGSTAASGGLITFNVPSVAAQWIASTAEGGGLYLTLVGPDYKAVAIPPLPTTFPLLPGEDPEVLTPCGPNGCPDN